MDKRKELKKLVIDQLRETLCLDQSHGYIEVEYEDGPLLMAIDAEWTNSKQQWTLEEFCKITDSMVEIKNYLIQKNEQAEKNKIQRMDKKSDTKGEKI